MNFATRIFVGIGDSSKGSKSGESVYLIGRLGTSDTWNVRRVFHSDLVVPKLIFATIAHKTDSEFREVVVFAITDKESREAIFGVDRHGTIHFYGRRK